MLADDRDAVERLDAYLDALASNQPAPPSTDPVWAEIARRLHALDGAPAPSPTFATRLLENLMPTLTHSQTWGLSSLHPSQGRMQETWRAESPSRPPAARHWPFGHLGAASIIVLTIVVSLLALDPGRFDRQAEPRMTLPAVLASPAAQVTAVSHTLLEVTIDHLPAGHQIIALERITLQPGSPAMVIPSMDGLVVIAPEAGELVTLQDGTETPLRQDTPLIASNQEVSLRVTGSDAGIVSAVYVIPAFVDADGYESDPLVHRIDRLIETSANDLLGGPARLVVAHLVVPPGSALPTQKAQPWMWTEVEDGALGLTLEGDRLPFRWTSGTERTFRLGQYLPPIQPGTQMTIRNVGETPLILNRLTILPQETAGTPKATPSP